MTSRAVVMMMMMMMKMVTYAGKVMMTVRAARGAAGQLSRPRHRRAVRMATHAP